MELKKTNEKWDRSFNAEGAESGNKLESVQFNIKDDDGNSIGNANINQYNGNANINIPNAGHADVNINGYSSIEQGIETLKAVLGISDTDE